jgi:diguanylate cyclase (GGDEF)-like protein
MLQWNIHAKTNQDEILRRLVENISRLLPAQSIELLTRDKQKGVYCTQSGNVSLNSTDPVITRLLAGEEFVQQRAVTQRETSGSTGTAFTTLLPIVVRGYIEHVLAFFGPPCSENDIHMALSFCQQAALAIETCDMNRNLDRKFDRLTSLVSLVDDITTDQNYRNLLQTVLEKSSELLLAEQGSIMLLEKETDALLLEASKGEYNAASWHVRIPKGVGIAGRVALLGEPILVENVEQDPRTLKKNEAKYKTSSFVCVPLKIDQRVVGVMNFTDKSSGEIFDDVDLRLAQAFASHAAVVLDRKHMYEQAEILKRQAITDDLTGLLNRGYLMRRMEEELARSQRYATLTSIVLIDVDDFKKINDTHGHAMGDLVLRKLAGMMTNAVRSIDIIGRYGGDEFIIILPETDTFFAAHIAERLLADITMTDFPPGHPEAGVGKITVSMGIATYPTHATSAEVLMEHADEALYRAKAGGRNRVVTY